MTPFETPAVERDFMKTPISDYTAASIIRTSTIELFSYKKVTNVCSSPERVNFSGFPNWWSVDP